MAPEVAPAIAAQRRGASHTTAGKGQRVGWWGWGQLAAGSERRAEADWRGAMARPLRLYRELLRAQRRFPVDAKRAEAQRDMRHLLHGRIRQAFEEGRGASGSRKAELLQHGEAELAALNTITSNHFAQQVRRSRHPRRARSLTRAVFAVPFAAGQPGSHPRRGGARQNPVPDLREVLEVLSAECRP